MARQSDFTQETADAICERIADGISMRALCAEEGMPNRSTVMKWIDDIPEFSSQYARAVKMRAQFHFDEMLEIADDASRDMITDGEGNERLNSEHVQRSKLRIDARKWVLSKMDSKRFGDKVTLAGDEDNPLTITTITRTVIDPKGDAKP